MVTRRQAKLKPLFAPIPDPKIVASELSLGASETPNAGTGVATCAENDDDLSTDDDDNNIHDVVDDSVFLPLTDDVQLGVDTKGARKDEPPTGLLGRTAPNAAANIKAWDPVRLREAQLQDPDIAGVLTAVETNAKPSWTELKSVSPALRALFQQYDSLVVVEGVLYRVFYDVRGSVRYYCLLYTSPSPRDGLLSRMPSSA